jgi:lysophospholipase L1-like esterase
MADLGTLALVGDSLTANGRWQDWLHGYDVLNFGVSGSTTNDVVQRLPEIIEARPDSVAILVGTNDLAWRRTVEHIVRNLETVLVILRREIPEVRILIQSVTPRGAEFADQIRDVNRHLWQFAPAVRAQYLDLWPALATDDGDLKPTLTGDGLHVNDAGYEVWLSELVPALERLANQPPTSRSIILPDLGGL